LVQATSQQSAFDIEYTRDPFTLLGGHFCKMAQGYGTMVPIGRSEAGEQRSERGCLPCTNCLISVPQDRFYATERFGEFKDIKGPGLWYTGFDMCGCCVQLRSITRRIEQNECLIETKTKDNVFVIFRVAIQQSVIPKNAKEAIYELSNVGSQVDSWVADVVRSHVPKMTLDEAFENKEAVSQAIKEQLDSHMTSYGFHIHKALVTEIKPSMEVVNAMNEINKQRRLRDAAQMAAEADKIRTVKNAEAESEAMRLQGEGIAHQRAAIVNGLKQSITEGTDEKLTSGKISELLLITQYFETLKEIGANSKTSAVFVPHSPGQAISDISAQIRDGVLQGQLSGAPAQTRM